MGNLILNLQNNSKMKFVYAALIASVSAECMDGIVFKTFSDDKCTTAIESKGLMQAEHKATKEELTEMNKDCAVINAGDAAYWKAQKFDAKSTKVTCDTKEMAVTVYADEKCPSDADKDSMRSMAITWDGCDELKMGETSVYVKVTGAMALQAAAAAALAFVGSQF